MATIGDAVTAASTSDGDTITAVSTQPSGDTLTTTASLEDDPIICEDVSVSGTRFKREVCQRRSVREENLRQSRGPLGPVNGRQSGFQN